MSDIQEFCKRLHGWEREFLLAKLQSGASAELITELMRLTAYTPQGKRERNLAIYAAFKAGAKMSELALRHGVSKGRVSQIIWKEERLEARAPQ